MPAYLANFRKGQHHQRTNYGVVVVDGVASKQKAESLVGKTVSWHAAGKNKTVISGKVTAPHGNRGAVRVLFERGLPGQAVGTEVTVS